MITGCGFPDLATRVLTSRLANQLKVPVLGLFDFNPFGLHILLTYKLGSVRSGLESFKFAVDIKWLGLHSTDVEDLNLVKQQITNMDCEAVKRLKEYEFVKSNSFYMSQLNYMAQHNCKVEIQAVNNLGFDYLSNKLVRSKILKHKYY